MKTTELDVSLRALSDPGATPLNPFLGRSGSSPPRPGDVAIERQYTISELSSMLRMSFERVRLLVKDEPGVLRFSAGNRARRTMYRIPESVVRRIVRRYANPG